MSIFAPFHATVLGFDRLFADLDRLSSVQAPGFPPFNLYKDGDDTYHIELAVAGYKKADITIEHNKRRGVLSVRGDHQTPAEPAAPDLVQESETREVVVAPARKIIKRGVAARQFTKEFAIADDLEVTSATLEDGMLSITVTRIAREEDKPVLINIA